MVEDRHAHLERDRHAGAIDLGEDVVGKIGHRVEILHAIERVGERGVIVGIEDAPLGSRPLSAIASGSSQALTRLR